ncbi:MAG: ATP-dependent helicase [Pseudohongiella sp.]|nr:MAG: ATP-dependent helicase [Pseudohongiella sp.]
MTIRRFDIEPLSPLLSDGYTLLTPNNRTVDAIVREYASEMRDTGESAHAWRRPAVFAIDIYIQQLWKLAASQGISPFNETQLLGRFDEQEIWLQIVRASYDKYPLLNSEETANSIARSYRFFRQWDVEEKGEVERYRNATDFQAFLSWSEQFEARCRKIGAVSLSDASRIITEHIEALKPILPAKIALIHFNQPPPLYAKLFESIQLVCELTWQRESNQEHQLDTVFNGSDSRHRLFQNSSAEINACIDWCEAKTEESPDTHIGIVLDHSRSLEPLLEEAFFRRGNSSNKEHFELASRLNRYHSGKALFDTPDFSNALAILALNHELIDSERFCALLQSPKLSGSDVELQARIALELKLRGDTEAEVRLSHLRQIMLRDQSDYYCPVLAEALLAFSELARHEPNRQSLRQWLALFSRQLQALGWPGNSSTKLNQSQSLLWQQTNQRLAASSSVLGEITLSAALAKLQSYLKQTNVNLNFDDRRQISLLDVEEAQDLYFDHLWILSVDDRNWPQAINPVAFLPYSMQLQLDMPGSSSQQQLDSATTQLASLRRNTAAEVVLSHHALEEELSIRPSALLRQIAVERVEEPTTEDAREQENSNNLVRLQESLHIPLDAAENVSGGTSLLSNQSNCPFRAFARNRLKAEGLEEFSHGLNSLARGNALHKALEQLGRKLGDSKTLHSLGEEKLQGLLTKSTEVAIDYLRKIHPETMTPAFSSLEQGRLTKLLQGFILIEKQRSEFTILHNEQSLSWQHSRLSLNLRIDRVDRLADGSLALIDYKTGKFTNYKWLDDRPDDLQLPLYQIAMSAAGEDPVSATLIYQLNAENTGVISPLALEKFGAEVEVSRQGKSFEGGWSLLQDTWNKRIITLSEEFESGLVAVAPTRANATCQYCDLGPLCRIAESDPSMIAANEEDL